MANDHEREFALSLPPALLSISPVLASIHAARAQRLYPETIGEDLSICRKCKTYLGDGAGAHRIRRLGWRSKRAKTTTRQLQVHCTACGADNTLPLPVDDDDASQFPMPRARARALARAPSYPQPVAEPTPTLPTPRPQAPASEAPSRSATPTPRSASPTMPPPGLNTQGKPRKRPKNKAGLQELLARKKQADSSKATASGNALSSFLSEL